MVSAGLALPCVGHTLPSTMKRFGTAKDRRFASTTPSRSPTAMRQPPMRCASRLMVMASAAPAAWCILFHDLRGRVDESLVVVAQRVGEVGHGEAMAIGLVGQGDAILGEGQELAQSPKGCPVHRVAHVFAQRLAPVSLCTHMLGEDDRQRRDALQGEASLVVLRRVSLVEGFGGAFGRRRLVGPDLLVVATGGLRCALHHDVAANLVEVVAQAVGELRTCRVEQQAGRLDGVARHRHQSGPLAIFASLVEIDDPGGTAVVVDLDAADHAVGPDLRPVGQRVGDVGDERGGLGIDLAPLQAEPR